MAYANSYWLSLSFFASDSLDIYANSTKIEGIDVLQSTNRALSITPLSFVPKLFTIDARTCSPSQ